MWNSTDEAATRLRKAVARYHTAPYVRTSLLFGALESREENVLFAAFTGPSFVLWVKAFLAETASAGRGGG